MNVSNRLQFTDTNILVYAYNMADPQKQHRAHMLINGLWESGAGALSIQVLQEFYVTVTRKIAKPLLSEAVLSIIKDLGNWVVHSPSVDDLTEAISIQQRNQLSFWDALMIGSAKKLGCLIIWTEDLNNGQLYEGIQALNPFIN
jgi:predicted nucleic acid-binding protein